MIQINRHQQKSTDINRHQHINTSFNGLLWLCFDFGYWKPLKTPNLQDLARSLKYAVLCEEVREKDRALPKMIIDANDLSFFWKFGFSMTIHQNKKNTRNTEQNTERTHRTTLRWSESDLPNLIFLRSRNGGFLLPSSSIGPQSTCRSRNERIVFFVAKSTGNSSDGRFAFCLQRCPVSWSSRTFKTPFSSHFFTELIIVFWISTSQFSISTISHTFSGPPIYTSLVFFRTWADTVWCIFTAFATPSTTFSGRCLSALKIGKIALIPLISDR